jgi:hypothetical protein
MKIQTDRFHVPARCVAAHSVAERPRIRSSLFNSRENNELLFFLSQKVWTHIVVPFWVKTCDGDKWEDTLIPEDCMVRVSHGGSDTVPGEWTIEEYDGRRYRKEN